jgi:hypothetical protein
LTDSQTIEHEPVSVGEALTHPDPAAFAAWQASNPEWKPISEYRGGYVLFGFDRMNSNVYGTRKADGSWWGFYDGEELRMDEESSETFRDLDGGGEAVTVRSPALVPSRFCIVPEDVALHFITL